MKTLITIVAAAALMSTAACTQASSVASQDDSNAVSANDTTATSTARSGRTAPTTAPEATAAAAEEGTCAGNQETGSCCGGWDQVPAQVAEVPDNATWTTMKVSGMTCGGCAMRIQNTLADVDGVLGVDVDHRTGLVKVATAANTADVRQRVVPRINALGYQVAE